MEILFLSIIIGGFIGGVVVIPLQNKYWEYKYRNLDIEKYVKENTEHKNGIKIIDVGKMNAYLATKVIDYIEKNVGDRL